MDKLRKEMREASEKARSIIDKAKTEKRDLTEDEATEVRSLQDRATNILLEIRQGQHEDTTSQIRQPNAPNWDGQDTETRAIATGGFSDAREFLQCVRSAETPGHLADPRLFQVRAATGLGVTVPSEGGFLCPTEFGRNIIGRVYEDGGILSKCDKRGVSGGAIEIPGVDETARTDGNRWGGLQSYFKAEAGAMTASQPKYLQHRLEPEELTVLVYVTDKLLSDGVAVQEHLQSVVPQEIAFKTLDCVVRGSGAGRPLGYLNSGCLVEVSKEGAQPANTILTANVLKMYMRHYTSNPSSCFWLCNKNTLEQLMSLAITVGTGGSAVFLVSGIQDGPDLRLLGYPIKFIEQASTLGTLGDISLCSMADYLLADKGGVDFAASIHVRFVYNESCFRWVYRIDGQPKFSNSLTPYQGSATTSPFVALETRS